MNIYTYIVKSYTKTYSNSYLFNNDSMNIITLFISIFILNTEIRNLLRALTKFKPIKNHI